MEKSIASDWRINQRLSLFIHTSITPQSLLTLHTGGATREQRRRGRLEASGEIARFLKSEERLFPVV